MNRRGDGPPVHAGVLVPWANTVVEAELPLIAGRSVTWHYARLVPASGTTRLDERFLGGLLDAVPAALTQLSALPLRCVYLACTSAAFMYPDVAKDAQRRASVTLVTAFDAITAALARLGITRVMLLTPYPATVTDAEAQMLRRSGITVTGCASLGAEDGYDRVTRAEFKHLIMNVSHAAMAAAEAVVLSCTGWPTLDFIHDMERDLGKAVLSSNLAVALHAQGMKET